MLTYISTNNLARYDGKIQEYAEGLCAPHGDACWRLTEKAQSVTFWPVGSSPLEGTVEFSFTETLPEGTKGPDNPSAIEGMDGIFIAIYGEDGVNEAEYSINLGGVYYGGSIDLATGLMTVTQGFAYAQNPENINITNFENIVTFNTRLPYNHNKLGVCNVLVRYGASSDTKEFEHFRYYGFENKTLLFIYKNRLQNVSSSDSIDAWRVAITNWLQENNVYFVYDLATPYTVQLTAPALRSLIQPDKYVPRPNTVYTDADAVQIIYQKSPIRDEFEKVQAIIAQGGNV